MPDPAAADDAALRPVRVWDLPTRLFHWLLALAVAAQIVTGHVGGAAMTWHFRIGYCVFALVGFRIVWGLVGGRWSRFSSFLYAPATVMRYLRGDHRPGDHFHVGHNPLGMGSVLAMLALLALQIGTGLLADDEIANVGPLNRFVSSAFAHGATVWHKGPGKAILIVLVALHVGAIVYYRVRRAQNLVQPMITGDKLLGADVPASDDTRMSRVRALALIAIWAGIVASMVKLGG
ncbi:MAG: cytochrome b/b6 domain-containing protein [Burkholderiaceae bacterium]